MSTDNGIYILQTKGPQFRVVYSHGIDDIFGNFSDESLQWQGDPKSIMEHFGDAPMFSNLEQALDFAGHMSYDYEYLEDGICVISDFKDWDFDNLRKNYGKEAEGSTR